MPLATILTSSSSGRGSQRSSRSMPNDPNRSRATAAVICMEALPCERIFQIAILVRGRVDDHLLVAAHELLQAAALNVLELHHDGSRGRPFAELIELDLPDDGAKRGVVDVPGKLAVIEAAGRRDRLLQDLHGGVCERRLIEPERIDPGFLRLRLKLLEKLVDARKVHGPAGHEEMVVH